MLKNSILLAAALMLAAPVSAAQAGPDAASCREGGGSALLVAVSGLKSSAGTLRVQLYGANPAEFLAKGAKLRRIDVPVTDRSMEVCVALPQPGRYAVAVRHDSSGNGSDWNDGGGFSRNPSISLTALKPKHSRVAFDAGSGVQRVPIVMQYRRGLSIGPLKQGG